MGFECFVLLRLNVKRALIVNIVQIKQNKTENVCDRNAREALLAFGGLICTIYTSYIRFICEHSCGNKTLEDILFFNGLPNNSTFSHPFLFMPFRNEEWKVFFLRDFVFSCLCCCHLIRSVFRGIPFYPCLSSIISILMNSTDWLSNAVKWNRKKKEKKQTTTFWVAFLWITINHFWCGIGIV